MHKITLINIINQEIEDGNVHNNRSTIHWNYYQFVVGKPELFYQLEIRFWFGEFLFQVLLAFIR